MKTKKILLLLLSCTLSLGIIGCGDYIVNQQPSNLGTSESKQDNNQNENKDNSKEKDKLIFDANKLYKAKKEDVDNFLGEVGEYRNDKPYFCDYTNHGLTTALFDDSGKCILLVLDISDKYYKMSDRNKVLSKYGVNVSNKECVVNVCNMFSYNDVGNLNEIDIAGGLYNDDNITLLMFYPEGMKKADDFTYSKHLESVNKKINNKPTNEKFKYVYYLNGSLTLKADINITKNNAQDIINEIYAIKGYKFKEEPYKSQYSNINLYPSNIDDMDSINLTYSEKNLIDELSAARDN